MSKLSFRARQVDYTKPLPIFLNNDLPDLQDFAAINRSVPQMPTGMEKDEEAEHHLQRALSALQAFGATSTSSQEYAIPTPKVEIDNKMYERIYNIECPKQKQYIRIQPFSSDFDYPDYDADYEDENWLKEQNKLLPNDFTNDLTLFFETVMDKLEKTTGHSSNIISLEEARLLLMVENSDEFEYFFKTNSSSALNMQNKYNKDKEDFLVRIYEYWKNKRLKHKHPLTPIVLTDKSGVITQPNNPFLVFRRRTEKMQTRKNRKNEEQSYEKMLILKRDLCKAQQILKLIKQRENMKKELLKFTLETFEKRFKSNDYDGSLCESIKCSLKPALVSSANGLLVQFGIQQQQQQNNNNKIISSKLKSLGTSSTTSLKKINSSPSINNLNDQIYKQNLTKINQMSDKQKMQSNSNKFKKGKSFFIPNNKFQDRNQKLGHDDDIIRIKSNNPNQNIYKTSNLTNLTKLTNNNNNNETRMNSNNNINNSVNNNLNPLKRKRLNNNDNILTINNFNDHSLDGENNQIISQSLDINELNKRLCQKFNIDVNDLNLCSNYEEQLKMNDITENLDVILSETFNKLSTSSEKDGYWCFKRKEGCKYLAQNSGSIFKNDPFDFYENTGLNSNIYDCTINDSNMKKVKDNSQYSFLNSVNLRNRLKNLQYYYYGYAITKHNRHLGLVKRRLGRGGRILFEKKNHHYNVITTESDKEKDLQKNSINGIGESLNRFKTFYPQDCFLLNNLENENNTAESLILPSTSLLNNIAVVPEKDKTKKLILKSLKQTRDSDFCFTSADKKKDRNNSSSDEDEDLLENPMLLDDKLVYDYRLFPFYQLNRMKSSNDLNKNENKSNHNLLHLKQIDANNNNDNKITNALSLNDSALDFSFQDEKDSNNHIGKNFIKLDLTSSNELNSEYYFKSNKYSVNMPNLKFAIKALCIPKALTDHDVKKKINQSINDENHKDYQDYQNNKEATHEKGNVNIKSTENFCKIITEKDNKNEQNEIKDFIAKPLFNGINNSISALQAALLARKQSSNNSNTIIQLNDNTNNNNNYNKNNLYDSNIMVNNINSTSTSSVPSSSLSLSSITLNKFINTGTDNSALPINGINGIGATIFKKKDENDTRDHSGNSSSSFPYQTLNSQNSNQTATVSIDTIKLNISSHLQINDNDISNNHLGNKVNKGINSNDSNNTIKNQTSSNENIVETSILAAQSQTTSSKPENKNLPMEVT